MTHSEGTRLPLPSSESELASFPVSLMPMPYPEPKCARTAQRDFPNCTCPPWALGMSACVFLHLPFPRSPGWQSGKLPWRTQQGRRTGQDLPQEAGPPSSLHPPLSLPALQLSPSRCLSYISLVGTTLNLDSCSEAKSCSQHTECPPPLLLMTKFRLARLPCLQRPDRGK